MSNQCAPLLIGVLSTNLALAQRPSFPPASELNGKKAGDVVLKEGSYGEHKADWGIALVPENRDRADSRTIRLYVVRRHALDGNERPPLFHLVGGPGQSNVWGIHPFPSFFRKNE